MDKQGSTAEDHDDTTEVVQESGSRETAPMPGSLEAENVARANKDLQVLSTAPKDEATDTADTVRKDVQATTEVEKALTYKDAKEAYGNVEYGDHAALEELNQVFCNKKSCFALRLPFPEGGKVGDGGWHCSPHPKTKLRPIEQSIGLAALINSKIDPEKMKAKAEENKARKNAEETAAHLNTIISKIETTEDLESLRQFARLCHEAQYIKLTRKGMQVGNGFDGSQTLVNAFNAQKEKFEIAGFLQEIEYAPDSYILETVAFKLHKTGYTLKKTNGKSWKAEAIEGKTGSKELTDALNDRREELRASEELEGFLKEMQEISSDEGLERFVWQVLHKKGLVKKINTTLKNGDQDWDVEAIEGKPGSEMLVNGIKKRRLAIPEEAKERARQEKERRVAEARKKLAAL